MEKYLDRNSVLRLLQGIKTQIDKSKKSVLDTKGIANGIASLDAGGNVPLSQLGNLDTTFFEVVTELPTDIRNIKKHIYILNGNKDGENNKYAEYIYTGDLTGSGNFDATKWEKLGDFVPTFDLQEYVKKNWAVARLEFYDPNFASWEEDDDHPSKTAIRIEFADGSHQYLVVPEASAPINMPSSNSELSDSEKSKTFISPGSAGFMSPSDKGKLDKIDLNALIASINAANTAANNTNQAIRAAETATTGAENVNATITEGNVFEVTDRTGTKKSLDMSGLVSAQNTIKELQNSKIDKTSILQELGEAEDKVMSQKAIKTELDKKFSKENIAQEFGDSDDKVVSQSALPFRYIQNEEFIFANVDAEDRLLFGIEWDGTPKFGKTSAVEDRLQEQVTLLAERVATIMGDEDTTNIIDTMNELKKFFAEIENTETLTSILDNLDNVEKNLDKTTIKDEEGNVQDTPFRVIENEEFIMAVVDSDDRVLAYRDSEGKKHEHSMETKNLEVSHLNLKGNSVNDIQDALKANGFDVKTPIDWSESSFIQIPEPRFAIANITNIDSMPTTKTDNKKAFFEFWDMQGNYFKKHAILNAQGRSSMNWEKKNISLDLCDDEWIGDETPKVRFGNWVPQDSFHVKAYYTDVVRGLCPISYKLYEQIVRTRGDKYDRPWKKALIDYSKIGTTSKSFGNPYVGDYDLLTDTGARCFPDGFPIAIYLNGKFYGIFSLQLKKHRDNYHLNKSTAEHVHLDGILDEVTIFNGKGNIDWSQFEVRNPKGLYAIGGNKYDADVKQEEIAGDTEVNAWIEAGTLPNGKTIDSKTKKALQMTAKVKKYILDFAETVPTIKSAMATYEASSKSEEDLQALKSVYEKYFDVHNMEDYMIIGDILGNGDGFAGNWQWFTYDGVKWWVGLYDCDLVFGGSWKGELTIPPYKYHVDSSTNKPDGYVVKYYNDDMKARYKELADNNIISVNNIVSIMKDWCMRIGTSFYKKEYEKWKDSPCLSDSVINEEYWKLLYDSDGNPQTDTSETFNATRSYNIGDVVSFGLDSTMGFYKFTCIKETVAVGENKPHEVSTYSPVKKFKHSDNIYRIEQWIEEEVSNMDKLYKYNRVNNF